MPLILGRSGTQYVVMITKLLSSNCGTHLVESCCKESNICCQTVNQCSILYSFYSVCLGSSMNLNGEKCKLREQIVGMMLAKTPETVIETVLNWQATVLWKSIANDNRRISRYIDDI